MNCKSEERRPAWLPSRQLPTFHKLAVGLLLGALVAAPASGADSVTGSSAGLRATLPNELTGYRLGDECPLFLHRDGFESGSWSQDGGAGNPIVYVSRGGYSITVLEHTITVVDPIGHNKVEHWGDPHENLNGKHIKDWGGASGWDDSRRSIVLGDGTKLTMEAEGPQGVVLHTSVYDGQQNLQVDNVGTIITHASSDPLDTASRDDDQHDGEAASFTTDHASAIATYRNDYNEDAAFLITPVDQLLGKSGGCASPFTVNDWFDDPRLGHT